MQKKKNKIINILFTIFIIILLVVAYQIYNKYNFNNFVKAERKLGNSKFERDSQIKCIEANSYKIENIDYNDAMFYEKIEVKPNTPYRVTCKIKTENVQTKSESTDSGANICIENTLEKSNNVVGTQEWTTVQFYFNSKNRTTVNVGFRLGSNEDTCKRNGLVFRL